MFVLTVPKRIAARRLDQVGVALLVGVLVYVGQNGTAEAKNNGRQPAPTQNIRLNSIGYPANATKVATVVGGTQGGPFVVRDVTTGAQVFHGKLTSLAAAR